MHGHHAMTADETDPTYAMERGTAVHAILFGTRTVLGYPGKQRKGKEYDAFVADHPDCEILTAAEYAKALRMADAVRSSAVAMPYLNGVCEETLHFRWMGLECRATPDVRGDGFVTELKSSQSADPAKFLWHARRMAYHAQVRFQDYACKANGHPVRDHWIVCVEAEAPHPVTVFHVEPEALDEGDKLLTLWAERLKACMAAQAYPPYVESPVPLCWPKDDFDLEFEEAA